MAKRVAKPVIEKPTHLITLSKKNRLALLRVKKNFSFQFIAV